MSNALQTIIFLTAIIYKILLENKKGGLKLAGWITAMICSALSMIFLALYMQKPILVSLEIAFFLFAAYGTYKHIRHDPRLITSVDLATIVIAFFTIVYFAYVELAAKTMIYELVASISFMIGILFIAQKNIPFCRIIGWIFYVIGSFCLSIVYWSTAPILVGLHFVSISIAAYNAGWLIYTNYTKPHQHLNAP